MARAAGRSWQIGAAFAAALLMASGHGNAQQSASPQERLLPEPFELTLKASRADLPEPFELTLKASRPDLPEPFELTLKASRPKLPEPFELLLKASRPDLPEPFELTLKAARSDLPEPFELTLKASRSEMPEPFELTLKASRSDLPEPFELTLKASRSVLPEPFEVTLTAVRPKLPEPFAVTLTAVRPKLPEPFEVTLTAVRPVLPEPFEVTLTAVRPKLTRVPKVLGIALKEAIEQVKDAKLRPRPALGNPAKKRDQDPLTVYESKPAQDAEVAVGDEVVLTAYGERPKRPIPHTEDMTLDQANERLSTSDFTPEKPSLGVPAPADKEPGRVQRTEPAAGTVAALFSPVKPVLYGAHAARPPPAEEPPQPLAEEPEPPHEPQIGESCGPVLSEAVREAMAKALYDTYENGRWKEKRKFNGVSTWEIHNQLRALILRGNYFAIHYDINKPIFQARIACKDSCIMATPKNYQIHEPAWRPFKDCIAGCDKIKFYACDTKGRITKLGTPQTGVTRR